MKQPFLCESPRLLWGVRPMIVEMHDNRVPVRASPIFSLTESSRVDNREMQACHGRHH